MTYSTIFVRLVKPRDRSSTLTEMQIRKRSMRSSTSSLRSLQLL